MAASRFSNVQMGAKIETFALVDDYVKDTFENKVCLVVGVYKDSQTKPWVLPVVRRAENEILNDKSITKEYTLPFGNEKFLKVANNLLLGENHVVLKENRVLGIQTISASGGMRLGAEFLSKILGYKTFYVSSPTYINHERLFLQGGFSDCRKYRYWSEQKQGLDIEGLLEDLENAPENSVILLHACAHNPTGCDPTEEEWKRIATVMKKRKLFPFFDSAYQGFATGDLDKDGWSVRYFAESGFELFCAQTFSKNFGLYSDRVGNLCVVMKDGNLTENLTSQFSALISPLSKIPPAHGAHIVAHILNSPDLTKLWKENMVTMAKRMKEMRQLLRNSLEKYKAPGDWSHVTSQIGMFSYTGLTKAQSEHMINTHHVYMLRTGRISMCGLTKENVDYVAKCICETLNTVKN